MRSALSIALTFATALLTGCYSTSAAVVSSGGGQSISQAQAAPYNGPQKRIAVSDFDVRSGQDSREIGSGMSDMLTNALFNTGRFIVLERDQLDEVMKEQDLANSGRFKKETAAAKGELEGAELLIRGSIIQFEPNCKGGSAILISGKQACMTINLRIVDAATGRVVNATSVEGTSASNRVGILWTRGASLPVGLGTYSKTPMETAIRNCIDAAVQHIVDSKL